MLAVILPNIITYYVSGLFSATVFFLSLGFWHFCCQADIREILYSGMLALFIQNLSSNVYNFVFYSIFRKYFYSGAVFPFCIFDGADIWDFLFSDYKTVRQGKTGKYAE